MKNVKMKNYNLELDYILESMTVGEIIYHIDRCGIRDDILTEGVVTSINKVLDVVKSAKNKAILSNTGVATNKLKHTIKDKLKFAKKHPVKATTRIGIHTSAQALGQLLPLHPIKGPAQSYRASKKIAGVATNDLTTNIVKTQLKHAIKNSPAITKKAFVNSVKYGPDLTKKAIKNTPAALKNAAVKTKDGIVTVGNGIKNNPVETLAQIANVGVNTSIGNPMLITPMAYGIHGANAYIKANKGHVIKSTVDKSTAIKNQIKDYIKYMKSPADANAVPQELWDKTGWTKAEIADYIRKQYKKKGGS